MEERVELIKTGLINLVLFIAIVFASFIVAIMSTRKLTPAEFGTYQFLINFSSYFLILSSTLSWFATRFTARKINIIQKLFIYCFEGIIFLSIIFFVVLYFINENVFYIGYNLIILTLLFMITMQIYNIFLGIMSGYNVVTSSFGNFIQAIIRLGLLLIIIYLLFIKISIEIILLVFVISNLVAIIFFATKTKSIRNYEKGDEKFKKAIRELWFFPFLTFLVGLFVFYDSVIVALFLANTLPLAYFRTAIIIVNIVNYIQALLSSFYKKYLETINEYNVRLGFKIVSIYLSFTVPLIIALGDILLAILRLDYITSYYALIILTIVFAIGNFSHLLTLLIQAKEKETEELNKENFFKLLKIDIFSLFIQYAVLAIVLFLAKNYLQEPYLIAFLWSFAWLSNSINSFILKYKLFKEELNIKIPLRNILKYTVSGIISGIVLFILKPKSIGITFIENFFNAIIYSFIYLIIFLIIFYFIDKKTLYKIYLILFKEILGKKSF
ncbi:MAG: hypothetical protein ACO2OV_03780 [Thermoproteota archaeon]|jgi:O-antigen/teichoic acid export membrane protein